MKKPEKIPLDMPLVAAMRAYGARDMAAFHTPGHKQGKGLADAMRAFVTPLGAAVEVSLADELDDLSSPRTCIKAAQERAAGLYGVDAAYFSVNGTTGAIQAMVLAALDPGDTVILPRNVHRSIFGALVLGGVRPFYMRPAVDEELGLAMGVAPETVEAAIRSCPAAKAVLVASPTYYGVASDLARIAAVAHAHGLSLLVDEAHGPHLKFHEALPPQAMDTGADLAAQSTHKILGSLTQTSLLLANFARVDRARLESVLGILQTTSPNYLLLASIDAARAQIETEGRALLDRTIRIASELRGEINRISGLYCFGEERMGRPGAFALDPTKLAVDVRGLGIGGPEAEAILRCEYGIQSELCDASRVLFILSYADGATEAARLIGALRGLAARFVPRALPAARAYREMPLPEVVLSPREAAFRRAAGIAFRDAAGRVSAETVAFYPPGIPAICPGERIDAATVRYCLAMRDLGLKVVGPADCTLERIQVVEL